MLRESNWEENELAQVSSGLKMSEELTHKLIVIGKKNHPSIYERGIRLEVVITDANIVRDRRIKIKEYLEDHRVHKSPSYELRIQAHDGSSPSFSSVLSMQKLTFINQKAIDPELLFSACTFCLDEGIIHHSPSEGIVS